MCQRNWNAWTIQGSDTRRARTASIPNAVDCTEKPRLLALAELLDRHGVELAIHDEAFLRDFKGLALAAATFPDMDSGVPRSMIGLPGNFTLAGLLHFLVIYSAPIPGEHTPSLACLVTGRSSGARLPVTTSPLPTRGTTSSGSTTST